MVLGLVGVITSSFSSSLEKSQASEEQVAELVSGTPASPSCCDEQRSALPSPFTLFLADSSCVRAREALGWTMGTLASTLLGDSDPGAPLSRTELPGAVS